MINLEEWKAKSKEKNTMVKKKNDAEIATETDDENEALIRVLKDTEKEIRRKEGKRKEGIEGEGRKPKRRKLERLTNWGEAEIVETAKKMRPI